MAEVLLNQEQIKEIIPHRDPFLLIDEVLEMEVGKRVVARKYIKAVTYGLFNAQERGSLFIGAGVPVYEGMVVGASPKAEDLVVNVCKRKHLTNTRASGSDDALRLVPPRNLSLEDCLEFLWRGIPNFPPKSLRIRKQILSNQQRAKMRGKIK